MAISSLITTRGWSAPLPISAEEMAAQVIGANGSVISPVAILPARQQWLISPRRREVAISTGVVLKVRRFTHVRLDLDDRLWSPPSA